MTSAFQSIGLLTCTHYTGQSNKGGPEVFNLTIEMNRKAEKEQKEKEKKIKFT